MVGKSLFGGVHDECCLGGNGNPFPVNGGDAFRSGAVVTMLPIPSICRAGSFCAVAALVSAGFARDEKTDKKIARATTAAFIHTLLKLYLPIDNKIVLADSRANIIMRT